MSEQKRIRGYVFQDETLFETSLTHSSYANENRSKRISSNERLEFLGDAILGFVSAEYLYRRYPELPEGELTKRRAAIVCEKSLCRVAIQWGLPEQLRLGRGEETGGGRHRPSILADSVEAVIAAVYLDGGMEAARTLIMTFLPSAAEETEKSRSFQDYKTTLQEIVQKNKQETLSYRLKEAVGPDHDKRFVVELLLNSNLFAEGIGRSKKEAEQAAAKSALLLMGEIERE